MRPYEASYEAYEGATSYKASYEAYEGATSYEAYTDATKTGATCLI